MSHSQHRDTGTEAALTRQQHAAPRRTAARKRAREQRERPWRAAAARRTLPVQS
jgi:hypothetical protein